VTKLSLPKDIQSFKDMKELVILGCKHLFEKCKKDKGEDWSKISHIPYIEIEAKTLQQEKIVRLNARLLNSE
ncbi:hypothetical protein R6Q59_016360, partial [Mikania micrantha]